MLTEPFGEVLPIQDGRRITELCDGAEHGEEVVLMVGIQTGDAVLVVGLQEEGEDVPTGDVRVVERKLRVDHVPSDHAVRIGEIVLVVAVGAAEGDDSRDGVAAAPCTAGSLLVVGPARRHIAQGDPGQGAYVDAYFHGCRAREYVDGSGRVSTLP